MISCRGRFKRYCWLISPRRESLRFRSITASSDPDKTNPSILTFAAARARPGINVLVSWTSAVREQCEGNIKPGKKLTRNARNETAQLRNYRQGHNRAANEAKPGTTESRPATRRGSRSRSSTEELLFCTASSQMQP